MSSYLYGWACVWVCHFRSSGWRIGVCSSVVSSVHMHLYVGGRGGAYGLSVFMFTWVAESWHLPIRFPQLCAHASLLGMS